MRTLGVLGEVCGLAAAICQRENCYPSDIYKEHLDILKERMRKGVYIRPYHAYNPGHAETLAFPGCGAFCTDAENPALPLDDKDMMQRINSMGVCYETYERFRNIENRDELTEEEQEICRRFYALIQGKKVSDVLYE